MAFRTIREKCETISDKRAMICAAISRNLSPSVKSGLSPSQIMIGRSDLLSSMETRAINPNDGMSETNAAQVQLMAIMEARNCVIAADSNFIIQAGLLRPLRANAREILPPDETVSIYQRIGKEIKPRRHHGYRIASVTERQLLVERNSRLFKIPTFRARGKNPVPMDEKVTDLTKAGQPTNGTDDAPMPSGLTPSTRFLPEKQAMFQM